MSKTIKELDINCPFRKRWLTDFSELRIGENVSV